MAKAVPRRKKSTSAPAAPPPAWLEKGPVWLTAVILFVYFIIRWGFRHIPIERDEGSYAYMGHLLLQGGKPYLDFYEMKPPALFYSYAFLSGITGGSLAAMHVVMALLLALGGWLIFLLTRRWADAGSAVVAVLAYAALTLTAYASGFSIQAEHLVGLFAIAGLWALTRGLQGNQPLFILLAGVLLCYGLLIKQNGLFFALLAITLVPAFHRVENPGHWIGLSLRQGGWLAAGALIPVAVFGALLGMQGALSEFWFWNVEYPKAYTSTISWELGRTLLTTGLKKMYADQPVFWAAGLAGGVLIWLTRIAAWKKWAVTGFLLAAMVSVTPGKRFYGHYFLHFFPALSVAAGAAVFALGRWLEPLAGRTARMALGPVLAVLLLAGTIAVQEAYYFRPHFTRILRDTYGSNPFPESRQLADYLGRQIQEGDGLLVLGSEPQLYAYTLADCPTRHHFMGFLLKNHPREKEWQKEVMDDVAANPPKYVVWVQHPLTWLPAQGADQAFIQWAWQWAHRHYTPIAWYDQTGGPAVTVVEGADAATYQARGQQYMILMERQAEAPVLPPG
ncbi:MAG: glycosyltransferase family 39 protein [Saprospiraceae bacterium]|nr:glycosyltransferase family 39 protein [Saprospiraceae bacterium]